MVWNPLMDELNSRTSENENNELASGSSEPLKTSEPESLRELDVAIAERVMGWKRVPVEPVLTNYQYRAPSKIGLMWPSSVPLYSVYIFDAMEVVQKMREHGWSFACTLYEGRLPYASFCKRTAESSRNAEAASLPEAICRAALESY